jgi:uncharacterized protein (TIGR01777 family)
MKVLIGGGSGFIGQNLSRFLLDRGYQVVVLARNKSPIISTDLQSFEVDLLQPHLFKKEWFEGVEAVVNLSGKSIFSLWTEKTREEIRKSRADVNRNLVDFIATLKQRPDVFISASASGYYGDRGETTLTEHEQRGEGFLADVCEAWEAEARKAESLGMRSVQIRTVPVLLESGGILRQTLKSMRFGFTFMFGPGSQWFPWIHMLDLISIYRSAIIDKSLSGPVNACAPAPVRFHDFVDELRKYKKAVVIPFPVFLLKLFLRETSDVILSSQKVLPQKLLNKNFEFSFPTIEEALRDIFAG